MDEPALPVDRETLIDFIATLADEIEQGSNLLIENTNTYRYLEAMSRLLDDWTPRPGVQRPFHSILEGSEASWEFFGTLLQAAIYYE